MGARVDQGGMRAGETVPGGVEYAQPLRWGLETCDPVVQMEETAGISGLELAPQEVVAGRMLGGVGS